MSLDPNIARKSIGARRNPDSADAILDAAEAVLLEAGYSGFSIEAVARRARAGKPTIYRWWPSKAALLINVYQRQKRFAYPDTGSLEGDLAAFFRDLFANWRDTPSGSIFRSIIAEAQSDEAAASALAEYAESRRTQTAQMIERAKTRGEVAAGIDATLVADILSSFAWARLLTGRLNASDAELSSFVSCLMHGIKKGGA